MILMAQVESIVILTGAGISAESGIDTFRDAGGLWEQHRVEDVATPEGFARNPEMVHDFYNQRRAGALAGIGPRVYRRRSKRPADTELRVRMKELASERRRFGYRCLHILLKRECWEVNWKKLYRIYREEGLIVRIRGGRKRAVGTRTPSRIDLE